MSLMYVGSGGPTSFLMRCRWHKETVAQRHGGRASSSKLALLNLLSVSHSRVRSYYIPDDFFEDMMVWVYAVHAVHM